MTRVVTLIVVIEQSFVTVVVTVGSDVEPEATTWPRTATIQVHGAVAPLGIDGDRDERPVRRRVVADRRLRQVDEEVVGRAIAAGEGAGAGQAAGGCGGHRHDIDERHDQRDGHGEHRRDGARRTAGLGSLVSVGIARSGADDGRRSSRRR